MARYCALCGEEYTETPTNHMEWHMKGGDRFADGDFDKLERPKFQKIKRRRPTKGKWQ